MKIRVSIFPAILLAMLSILMSGSTLFSHYCGGSLKKTALNVKVDPCHPQQAVSTPACHAATAPSCHAPRNNPPEDCCHDEVVWQQTDDYVVATDLTAHHISPPIFTGFVVCQKWEPAGITGYVRDIDPQKPPLPPPANRQVTLQVFRL